MVRLASFLHEGHRRFGAVAGAELIDLFECEGISSVCEMLDRASLPAVEDACVRRKRVVPLDRARLLPPLLDASRCFWIGANYRTLRSNRDGSAPNGTFPSLFMRTPDSIVGHDAALIRPLASRQLDYEGEVVIVIGKGGLRIAEADALDHIGAFTIANDGCLRDWMDHNRNVTPGKCFDATASMGPWLVTSDEVDPRRPFMLETRVNGELRQQETTAQLRFSFAALIAYVSTFTALKPGDMISTGSPQGAGGGPYGADPPRWLVPGDTLEISVPGIGTLRNRIIDEKATVGGRT